MILRLGDFSLTQLDAIFFWYSSDPGAALCQDPGGGRGIRSLRCVERASEIAFYARAVAGDLDSF
jgi:hypothetical protein